MNMKSSTHKPKAATWLSRLLFLLILSFSAWNEASATHMAGGDIEYECIGPRRWKVRLIVYRYCGPGAADLCFSFSCPQPMTATPSPTIAGGGLNPNGCSANPASVPFTVQLVKVEDAEKSRVALCGAAGKNACTNLGAVAPGTYAPGAEKYTFEGELNLNLPSLNAANTCPYWDLGWSYCCRNSTENVQGQPSFFLQATINIFDRTATSCFNSSPVLKQEAIITFCAGVEQIFNMGAVDPDRDSLSYEITKSLQAPNTPVNYNPPYSEARPFPLVATLPPHNQFPGTPFVVLDTITGDVALNPLNTSTQPIAGDLSVRIKQWNYREEPAGSGIMKPYIVGITMRNLQIISIPCPGNNPPRFATSPALPDGKPKYNWEVCAGQQICFTITAKDTDFKPANTPPVIDSTFMSWSEAIVRPANKLSFKPDYNPNAIPSEKPREDRWMFCWQTDSTDGSLLPYYFTVRADDNRCPNPGKVIRTFSILVKGVPMTSLVKTSQLCGKWLVDVRKENLHHTLSSAKLEIANAPYDYTFANGARVVLSANPNPGGAAPKTIISETVQFTQPGLYLVKYSDISAGGCGNTILYDTLFVDSSVMSVDVIPDVTKCRNDSVLLTGTITRGTAPFTYRWFRNTTSSVPVNGPNFMLNTTFYAKDVSTTKYILRVQDLAGCIAMDSVTVTVKSPVDESIQGQLTALQATNEYDYSIASNAGHTYQWSAINGTIVLGATAPDVRVKWLAAGPASLTVLQTYDGCTDVDSINVTIGSVGLKDLGIVQQLFIKPNPNNGSFTIGIESVGTEPIRATLHNVLGELVWSNTATIGAGSNELEVNVQVPDGIYLLTVNEQEAKTTRRVLISR